MRVDNGNDDSRATYVAITRLVPCVVEITSGGRAVSATFPRIRDVTALSHLKLFNMEDDGNLYVGERLFNGQIRHLERLMLRLNGDRDGPNRSDCGHDSVDIGNACEHTLSAVRFALSVCDAATSGAAHFSVERQ